MPPQRRSWVGCARCKSFKKKCSEERPSCQRCQTAGVKCEYGVKLRWGGRPFNRSPFGDCLSQNEGNVQRLGKSVIRCTRYILTISLRFKQEKLHICFPFYS